MRSNFQHLALTFGVLISGGLVIGCRGGGGTDGPASTGDMATGSTSTDMVTGSTSTDMATGGGADGPVVLDPNCGGYAKSTIAAMRQGKSGCYELDMVVNNGVTPGTTSHKMFVQDTAGGDFSGMYMGCLSTSKTHPCPAATFATTTSLQMSSNIGKVFTIQGDYIKSASNGFEEFYIDTIVDSGTTVTPPAPVVLQLADIERGGKLTAKWFQKVSVTLADPLQTYDLSPSEFLFNTTACTKCPCQLGFGMIDSTKSPMALGCTGTMAKPTSPVGVTMPDATEVLIDTSFYKDFTISSDCMCTAAFGTTQVLPASKVSGTIMGMLNYDVEYMTTNAYQFLSPVVATDFVLQ